MNPDALWSVLGKLAPEALRELIGADRLDSIRAVIHSGTGVAVDRDSSMLATLLLVTHGEQVLEDSKVRSRLLTLLPSDELEEMALALCGRSFEKSADNVLALASLPWRPGAAIALEFVGRFNVPARYLPKNTPLQVPTSVVHPFVRRPRLRDYQEEVRKRILGLLRNGARRILIQMPTGAGKTRTVMETLIDIARRDDLFGVGKSVLWLAHVEELCEQAVTSFEDAWTAKGNTPATVVRAWGSHKPNIEDYEGAFIVSTYQKLVALRKRPAEFEQIRRPIGLVVADEAHKVLAPTFEELLEELITEEVTLIGLTATPGRGLDRGQENVQLAVFFEKNLVGPAWSDNPIGELQERGILARIRHRSIDSSMAVALTAAERAAAVDSDLPGSVLSRLASSADRNRRIIDTIRDETSAGRSCLVFACTAEHSRILTAILNIEGERAAHLDSSVSKFHRREVISNFRSGAVNVLLNFGVLSTGFDVPRVSAVVIARPTTSVVLYSQMIGRGLRGPASGGSPECDLIDVRDNFLAFGAVEEVYTAFAPYWN
jgi:superfamily II DNA or RNA helicase